MPSKTSYASLALSLAVSSASTAYAFTHTRINTKAKYQVASSELQYRSLHHGPDVEPLSDNEKLGADFTKMDKDKIQHYGPGDFTQYMDSPSSHLFDGGDSEMGLSGDGNIGIRQIGRDVSPHMARTLAAKMDQASLSSMSYTDELLQNNPGMDATRAQQLENWATQQEIAMTNRYMEEKGNYFQGTYMSDEYGYGENVNVNEDEPLFADPIQPGDSIEGIITLRAPVYGVAAHEIVLKNPYMGYAKFRTGFVGDSTSEWSVTPSDGFLKQHEATHFVLRYTPHSPGVSNAHFVIETEDFKHTWKVVGSSGEYEF